MMRVWHLSVAYIGPKSRTERGLGRLKLAQSPCHTWLDTTFKVKRSTCRGRGILWQHSAQLIMCTFSNTPSLFQSIQQIFAAILNIVNVYFYKDWILLSLVLSKYRELQKDLINLSLRPCNEYRQIKQFSVGCYVWWTSILSTDTNCSTEMPTRRYLLQHYRL